MNRTTTRRQALLSVSGLTCLALVGCATGNLTPQQDAQQIINDISLAYQGIEADLPQMEQAYPKLFTPAVSAQIQQYMQVGDNALAKLQQTLSDPTQAGSWAKLAESNLNNALSILLGFNLPAPWSLVIMAANVTLPPFEQWLNMQFGVQVRRTALPRNSMSLSRARSILRKAASHY